MDDYLRFYARGYRPPDDLSRGDWEALRRTRILGPEWIEVELSAVEVESLDAERARVSFVQRYRSDSFRDVVRKTQELVREDGAWRILTERAELLDSEASRPSGS